MASTYLTRTNSSVGNRQISTFSGWLKKGSNGVDTNRVFLEYNSGTNYFEIRWRDVDNLRIYQETNGGTGFELITNRVFRDPSAWYHIVVAIDTTQGTAADRIKVYVNGVQETSFATSTYPSEDFNIQMNVASKVVSIGAYQYSGSNYFDGSMAMMEWVDGQQLTPAYFGSTDSTTGIWTPQASSTISSYGTNGFKLKMDTTSPGADTSGKGNTFTPSGTPTLTQGNPQNNWCTFNSIYKSQETLAYGNTASSLPSSNKFGGVASMGVNTGKWYAEFKMNSGSSSDSTAVGIYGNPITASNNDQGVGKENNSLSYNSNGQKGLENSFSSYGASYTTGNVIGVALDMTSATKNITFYKDGASQGNITFNLEQGNEYEGFMFMAANSNTASIGSDWWANFGEGFFGTTAAGTNADGNGQGLFAYAVPSGYYALNTKNLEAYG